MNGSVLAEFALGLATGAVRIVDLTAPLATSTPTLKLPAEFGWREAWPFSQEEISRYDERGPLWYWNNFKCGEHTGTHFDAPIHWVTGRHHEHHATDTLPLERFVAPAVVIDASDEARANPDYLLTVDFVRSWEAEHGEIPQGSWVLYRTDWSQKSSAEEYINLASDGCHSPGWEPATVTFLAEERGVAGVGTETVGTDAGQATGQEPGFPCHSIMHGANRCGLASLCNLHLLPPTGSVIVAAPLKIHDGTGSPLRVLALVPGT